MARILRLLLFIFICLFVGGLGSLATESSRLTWYAGLEKPSFAPPDWIFAPAWIVLYICMAVAGWRIWEMKIYPRSSLKFLFVIQLMLNGVWSFLFFGLRSPFIGLVDISCLLICLFLLTASTLRANRTAGILLIPYLAWTSFALYLNAAIWWMNR